MTGDERLAKVAEVLHAEVMRQNPGHADWTNCPIDGPCAEDTQALASLLDEFRAEDEARALRVAGQDFLAQFAGCVASRPLGVRRWLFDRAALAAAEPDAGER